MSSHFHFELGEARPIEVNVPDRQALARRVRAAMREPRGFALATINLDHLVKLRASEAFRRAYLAQDMVVADGNPIVWLSRVASRPVELAPGSDLVVPIARIAAETGVKVALVGATPPVLAAAAAALRAEVAGLEIAAELAPSQGFDPYGAEADALFETLGRSGAGLVLLALGAPRQEILAARGRRALPQMGFVSIGAGLDFLAGSQTRAPGWVRRLSLEWLWRMVLSPRRLAARYARCALILPRLAVMALRLRLAGAADGQDGTR